MEGSRETEPLALVVPPGAAAGPRRENPHAAQGWATCRSTPRASSSSRSRIAWWAPTTTCRWGRRRTRRWPTWRASSAFAVVYQELQHKFTLAGRGARGDRRARACAPRARRGRCEVFETLGRNRQRAARSTVLVDVGLLPTKAAQLRPCSTCIQEQLEAIYGIRCEYRAKDFLVRLAERAGAGRHRRAAREELLVAEGDDGLELAALPRACAAQPRLCAPSPCDAMRARHGRLLRGGRRRLPLPLPRADARRSSARCRCSSWRRRPRSTSSPSAGCCGGARTA